MSARAVYGGSNKQQAVQHSSTLWIGAVDSSATQRDGAVHKQLSALPMLVCVAPCINKVAPATAHSRILCFPAAGPQLLGTS